MKVKKRDGRTVDFDGKKIQRAVEKAMASTMDGVDSDLASRIAGSIENEISDFGEIVGIDTIQDAVEMHLMSSKRKDVAKRYIIYRAEQDRLRHKKNETDGTLTDDFINQYKHKDPNMSPLASFVYYKNYAAYIADEDRFEEWYETVRRAVEYNISLAPSYPDEAEKLYDNIFNFRQFLPGRTLKSSNTNVSKNYPMSAFNCAFTVIDNIRAFKDIFYLLMLGSGIGVRVLKADVSALPKFRHDIKLIHKDHADVTYEDKRYHTSLNFISDNEVELYAGYSIEGKTEALDFFLKLFTEHNYKNVNRIYMQYSTSQVKSSAFGYEVLKDMFQKIYSVIIKRATLTSRQKISLTPIDCADIVDIIGENVRLSEERKPSVITLFDSSDEEMLHSKDNLMLYEDGNHFVNPDISFRKNSENAVFFTKKPSREEWRNYISKCKNLTSPGFVNETAAAKRRPNIKGVDPGCEALLDSNGVSGLTTVNVCAFVKDDGSVDTEKLFEAQKLSVRASYRMTTMDLELKHWDIVHKRDRVLGCSLTGWQDMINLTQMNKDDEIKLLKNLKTVAENAASEYSKELGLSAPLLVTTIKPEASLSNLPVVSSGAQFSPAETFVKKMFVRKNSPIYKVCSELGYSIKSNSTGDYVEFPIKSAKGKTKFDVDATEQLQNYLMFMKNYADHNCALTIDVYDDEWDDVEDFIWDNWEDVVSVKLSPIKDEPSMQDYFIIDESEYDRRKSAMRPFLSHLLTKYMYKTQDKENLET